MLRLLKWRKARLHIQGEPERDRDAGFTTGIKPRQAVNKGAGKGIADRHALTALNVKVICDLATLTCDMAKYERFREQAIGMALSIQDQRYRDFAIEQVVRVCRLAGETHMTKELFDQVIDGSVSVASPGRG